MKVMDKDTQAGQVQSGFSTLSSSIGEADNYTKWILNVFSPYVGTRLVEIGLGYGNFLPFLHGLEDYLGVDIDEDVVAAAAVARADVDFMVCDISEGCFPERVGIERFDTALCVNVLEHVDDDRTALENLLSVTRPGGHLLLFVPAFEFLYTSLDQLAGHLRRYRLDSLSQVLPESGVRVKRLEYFNPVGGVGWFAQKLVKHEDLDSGVMGAQIRIFDRYVLPLSRMFNPLTRRVFGQSIVCVVEKL